MFEALGRVLRHMFLSCCTLANSQPPIVGPRVITTWTWLLVAVCFGPRNEEIRVRVVAWVQWVH